jgi:hypothetical protein
MLFIPLLLFSVSLENSVMRVEVDDSTGRFTLGTIDGKSLLDGFPDSPFATHFVVNRDYSFVSNVPGVGLYLSAREESRVWEDRYITTQWTHDNIDIWQKLRFMEDDSLNRFLNIEVLIYNDGLDSSMIGLLYFLDLKINENDNPVVASPWAVFDHDMVFTGTIPAICVLMKTLKITI